MEPTDKKKYLSQLFWDKNIPFEIILEILNGKTNSYKSVDSTKIYIRLLESYNWHVILQILNPHQIKEILSDNVIKKIWNKPLRKRYEIASRLFQQFSVSTPK